MSRCPMQMQARLHRCKAQRARRSCHRPDCWGGTFLSEVERVVETAVVAMAAVAMAEEMAVAARVVVKVAGAMVEG